MSQIIYTVLRLKRRMLKSVANAKVEREEELGCESENRKLRSDVLKRIPPYSTREQRNRLRCGMLWDSPIYV
jgi:hypothetical protein